MKEITLKFYSEDEKLPKSGFYLTIIKHDDNTFVISQCCHIL